MVDTLDAFLKKVKRQMGIEKKGLKSSGLCQTCEDRFRCLTNSDFLCIKAYEQVKKRLGLGEYAFALPHPKTLEKFQKRDKTMKFLHSTYCFFRGLTNGTQD